MKRLYCKSILTGALIVAGLATSCSDRDDVVDPEYDRLFSPINVSARIVSQVNALISWGGNDNVESYTIEVFANDSLTFAGLPVRTIPDITSRTYTVEGLESNTGYSARVQAASSTLTDSKWSGVYFKTGTEQIFKTVDPEGLTATEVTLNWEAGQAATKIIVTPGNSAASAIHYTVTADDVANGYATIDGLTGETDYTAVLYNDDAIRGRITFTTPVDIGGATLVEEGDDLAAMLAAATEGEVFALMPGEYALDEFTLTVSIALKGVRPANKPVVKGRFLCGTAVASLVLDNIIFDGTGDSGNHYVANLLEVSASACNLGTMTVTNCEIRKYTRALLYNNSSGALGNITFADCVITDTEGDGGDGIDLRNGTMASLTIQNCTFNTGFRAFLRAQINTNIAFRNCTFFRICNVFNSNNSGLFRISGGTLEVSKCLFVETGYNDTSGATTYGNWCKQASNMGATPTYKDNYYYNCYNLWVGLYTDPATCKATEADPGFRDAGNGDFTLSNDDMIYYEIGDQRWR